MVEVLVIIEFDDEEREYLGLERNSKWKGGNQLSLPRIPVKGDFLDLEEFPDELFEVDFVCLYVSTKAEKLGYSALITINRC